MNRRERFIGTACGLVALLLSSPATAGQVRANPAPDNAVIYFSAAPWDGPAYEIQIPLGKTREAAGPVIRINIWGNPEYAKPKTLRFTGTEDAGGGASRGAGRASFQPVLNQSLPENLAGSISFARLVQTGPVIASYDLATSKGRRFKGEFRAAWGNKASPGSRGG